MGDHDDPFMGHLTDPWMGYFTEPWWLVLCLQQGGSSGLTLPFWVKTYTFHAQDVYVSRSKRIRFTRDTYTFRPSRVYVSGKRPYPLSPRDACEDGDKVRENWG